MMGLADLSVSQVQSLLEEHFEYVESNWNNEDVEGIESWHELKYGCGGHVTGLGKVSHVDSYGGEGKGDEYWVVFSVTDWGVTRHFRMDGWYASYSGAEFDGDLKEVAPKQKVITVWE
jgi:hypothetical protein